MRLLLCKPWHRRVTQPESSPPYRHSVDAQSRGTDRANKQLRRLRVPQATCDDPDKTCHHRCYAKYNQVFHFYFILFAGDEIGTCAFIWTSRSSQLGHGWPQRSQVQPATTADSRTITLAGAFSCNISLAALVSSFNKRVVFIGAPFARQRYSHRWRWTPRRLAFPLQKLLSTGAITGSRA